MALIGSWGGIVFSVSPDEVRTFDELQWSSSAKYAVHDRHLKDQLIEFTRTNADTISFSMFFSVFLGVNPLDEITKLLNAERNGEVNRLVIGTHAYGKHNWVITQTSKNLEKFDNHGNLLAAKVSVSLLAYSAR
jgi:hypothetical protein